ncbi:hypothetical protein ACJMK2_035201 [Sinanodonta woodiana]|uniref:Uncharacterized protein n=1 Tax=Sinanodonta woodiana TaxID=1069815 RepID=A0ABD3WU54_SINWO
MLKRGDILYSQARRVMNHCHTTPPWSDLEPCQELVDETGDHSQQLLKKSKHIPSLKSRVVCENFSNKPVQIKELSIEEFWEFLYSKEWDGGNSIRVLDGQLLRQLSHSIVFLRHRGQVVAHTTFAYAKQICPESRSPRKENDKETINSVEETLLIELTNLGRLTKPLPNKPMADSVHVGRVYQYSRPRRKKTKTKPQIIKDVKSASDNTSLQVPKPTIKRNAKSQLIVPIQGSNQSDLLVKSPHASAKGKMSPLNSATQERRSDGNTVKLPLLGKRKCDDWVINQAEYLEESTKLMKTQTNKLLMHQGNLEKCSDKYIKKLPRLSKQRNDDREECSEYSIESTESLDTYENKNPITNQLQKSEKDTMESEKKQSIDDLDEGLYLGNEFVPPEFNEVKTAVIKLKIRKQELQKERELKKLLMKQKTEVKPFIPKLKPLDNENISLQLVNYPILHFETVPTLEEMIRFIKDDEHIDPRFKVNQGKYKKKKIIRKYNLSRDTIMRLLKGIHRRHAVSLHTNRFGNLEDFVKTCSPLLQNENNKKSKAKSKSKLESVVETITDSNACTEDVQQHAMTDQRKSILYVQHKAAITPLKHSLTPEHTKKISMDVEDTSPIQNVSKSLPFAPITNATLTPLDCESNLDRTERMSNFLTEYIPNPDILVTSSTGEIVMTMKTARPLSVSNGRGIKYMWSKENVDFNTLKYESETMNEEGSFCMYDDNSDEPSILKSSDESDVEREQMLMEAQNLNMYDTDNFNALDSVQNVRIKKLTQKRMPSFMDVVKKYVRIQEILKQFPKVQPIMEDRMKKEKAKNLKVPDPQQDETNILSMQNVVGTLRAFNFLSKSPIQKQTSRSTPSKLHFPSSYTTEKFMLKFSQAIEDFVVRREIVISNHDWKCSNSVTFTRKTVFTLRKI